MVRASFVAILLSVMGTLPVKAQMGTLCWDCELQYFPGEDCWEYACTGTYEQGNFTSCGQQGQCGSGECTPSHEIFDPYHEDLALDGRIVAGGKYAAGLSDLTSRGYYIITAGADRTTVAVRCKDAVVAVFYGRETARTVRSTTAYIVL